MIVLLYTPKFNYCLSALFQTTPSLYYLLSDQENGLVRFSYLVTLSGDHASLLSTFIVQLSRYFT